MSYEAMMDVKSLVDSNYLDGSITRNEYHAAIKGLHTAYAGSNGLLPCVCLSCTHHSV